MHYFFLTCKLPIFVMKKLLIFVFGLLLLQRAYSQRRQEPPPPPRPPVPQKIIQKSPIIPTYPEEIPVITEKLDNEQLGTLRMAKAYERLEEKKIDSIWIEICDFELKDIALCDTTSNFFSVSENYQLLINQLSELYKMRDQEIKNDDNFRKKDVFETTDEYNSRINQAKMKYHDLYNTKVTAIQKKIYDLKRVIYLKKSNKRINLDLNGYDADLNLWKFNLEDGNIEYNTEITIEPDEAKKLWSLKPDIFLYEAVELLNYHRNEIFLVYNNQKDLHTLKKINKEHQIEVQQKCKKENVKLSEIELNKIPHKFYNILEPYINRINLDSNIIRKGNIYEIEFDAKLNVSKDGKASEIVVKSIIPVMNKFIYKLIEDINFLPAIVRGKEAFSSLRIKIIMKIDNTDDLSISLKSFSFDKSKGKF